MLLLGIFLVLVSLLLFTYYRLKANENDLNRPSFFNSKVRECLLLIFIIFCFSLGEYLIIRERSYVWILLVPLLYLLACRYYKSIWNENIVMAQIFKHYKIFADPTLGLAEKDRLSVPVLFLLGMAKQPKEFTDKAKIYLEKRIEEGKIRTVKDLPSELKRILNSVSKKKIEEAPEVKFSESKIDYYYQKLIEDKTPFNLALSVSSWLRQAEAHFEKLFNNFAFICLPRPDFTQEEVQLTGNEQFEKAKAVDDQTKQYAVFPQVPAEMAKKFGWVVNVNEYSVLAALEFQRRFPEHKFSKLIKKQHKYSKDQIFEYAQNWQKLDISKIKLST